MGGGGVEGVDVIQISKEWGDNWAAIIIYKPHIINDQISINYTLGDPD